MKQLQIINYKFNFGFIIGLIFFISLFLSFYKNIFLIAEPQWFHQFQKDSESLVIGRLVNSQQNGLFSDGGLTGSFSSPESKNISEYQYEVLIQNVVIDKNTHPFYAYKSQIGGQAIVFSVLNKILPYGNLGNLITFYILTSILSSLVFTFFLYWVTKTFNSITGLIAFFLLLLSHWPVVFGRNLWWSLWSFYVPFVALLFILKNDVYKQKIKHHASFIQKPVFFFLISFLLLFIKSFFTGFEYITTVIIMGGIPFIFYSVLYKWNKYRFIKYVIAYAMGALSAILLTCFILSLQLSALLGGIDKGYEHLIHSFNKRTSGNGDGIEEIYRSSLQSDVTEVLSTYWNGIAIDLNTFIQSKWISLWQLSFGEIIVIFMLFSSLALISEDISIKTHQNRKKNIALMISTFVSILAPLSWFVIFKGHSYIHVHMNYIVWYMPFLLFGFTIIGSVSVTLTQDLYGFCYGKLSKKNLSNL